MVVLAVDDEQLTLDALVAAIREAAPSAVLHAFRRASEALAFAQDNAVDVAFLDIQMRGMDGLELGTKLLELDPDINIIFCTSFDEYVSEAFRKVRCNGYITKPVDAQQIAEELSHLRVTKPTEVEKRVYFQCFGRFEAFIDGAPIRFENVRTKELLACLVDACGGISGNQELIVKLWEDDNRHDSYFKKIRKDLEDTLTAYGLGDLIVRQRGGIGINMDMVDCDYYDWRTFHPGEKPDNYMTQYYWAMIPDYE